MKPVSFDESRLNISLPDLPLYLPLEEEYARITFVTEGDKAAFLEYYRRAEAGSPAAQAVIASMFLQKWVVDDWLESAVYWARKSAEQDYAFGFWVLAWALLESGKATEGVENMVASAERGFSPALHNLGSFLINGVVVPKDTGLGYHLVQRAAKAGHSNARGMLETARKAGYFGFWKMLTTKLILPVLRPIRMVLWYVFAKKFTEKDLVYMRSLHVENALRRALNKENIGSEMEDRIDAMIERIHSENRARAASNRK